MACVVLCRTGTRKNGLCTHFPGPETVFGDMFQLYFNGFPVSSPGARCRQYERLLDDINPSPYPSPGPGKCLYDYTISVQINIKCCSLQNLVHT